MGNRQHGEDTGGDGFDGEQEPDGPDEVDTVFFDVAEVSGEETEWRQGPDYTRSMRAAKQGERVIWRLLRGVRCRGTQVRTKAWCTRDGEPVTRVDLHPDGWRELVERIRALEAQAAEAERYRRLLAQRDGQQEGEAGKTSGRSWRRFCPRARAAVLTVGELLAR